VELRQLEYFVAVAEHLHFGRAAAQLSIGQPAVSQQVARLERELGIVLFDRGGRSVNLTAAGAQALPYAREALAAAGRFRAAAGPPGPNGSRAAMRTLRLGSSTGLGDRLGIVLQSLAKLLPHTETLLVNAPTRARLERVAGGQLDAAFVRGVVSAPGVELIEVWRDRLLVVLPAGHELAAREFVELAALAPLPLHIVSRKLNPPLVDLVFGACADAGFTPTLGSPVDGLDNTHALIAAGAPSWTVIYEAHARALHHPHVAFRRTRPELVMPTELAVAEDATSRAMAPLLRACIAAEQRDRIDQ
jgi:DNA-binding transcriptional LysR family regulator